MFYLLGKSEATPAMRAKICTVFLLVGLVTIALLPVIGLERAQAEKGVVSVASIGSWQKDAGGGFGNSGNFMVWPMVDYRGSLYAGIGNQNGCQVRVKSGSSWNVVPGSSAGFGNANNMAIFSMKVYEDRLYVGTMNHKEGCEVWRYDGSNWTELVGGSGIGAGFGSTSNIAAFSMEVHANKLYVGTYNFTYSLLPPIAASEGAQIWEFDGTSWRQAVASGFGDTRNFIITSLKEYNGTLYAGTLCCEGNFVMTSLSTADVVLESKGCQLWSQGATGWNMVAGNGFGRSANAAVTSMDVYKNKLMIGTSAGTATISINLFPCGITGFSWKSEGLGIYEYGGAGVSALMTGGLESVCDFGVFAMTTVEIGGKEFLLAAIEKAVGDKDLTGYVAAYNGSTWFRASQDGMGNSNNELINSLITFNGRVYAGTLNDQKGSEIWWVEPEMHTEPLVISSFYFAEGYTGTGFQEYLSIGNPTGQQAAATITYMFKNGGTQSQTVSIPANSRATVDVNTVVGPDKEVSAKVESEQQLIAERPMYFDYQGKWTGGHDALGATAPSLTWYFAEGYTGPGFDEWICVLNPGATAAELTFHFQTQEAGEKVIAGPSVPPDSRQTFKANDLLGGISYQTSLELASTQPVVAERPMYFNYSGTADRHWDGGHCVMGTTNLANDYYFAEGTTRSGFEEWLTLQNPGPDNLIVNAVYQLGPGQGGPIAKSYPLPPASRQTVLVPDQVGSEKDVSVHLSCSAPFLAERPMYFNYSYGDVQATGGHCVIGAESVRGNWFVAEGYTGSGFNEWLCLQNPGDSDAVCEVTYYTQEAGALAIRQVAVPAGTRKTIMVNEDAGAGYQLSTRVMVTSGSDIVVERPMYFVFRGWDGGHDAVAFH